MNFCFYSKYSGKSTIEQLRRVTFLFSSSSFHIVCLLFNTNNRSFLILKIVDILRKYVQQRIEETETLDQKRFKVAVDLCIPGIISVYMNWFTNSYDYSIEELSSLLTDFILNGIQKNWPGN